MSTSLQILCSLYSPQAGGLDSTECVLVDILNVNKKLFPEFGQAPVSK